MMKHFAALVMFGLVCTGTLAAPAAVSQKEAAALGAAVMKFAGSSACASTAPQPKMMTRLVGSNHTEDDTFIVLLNVDLDCHHAKDSWDTQIYVVQRPPGNFASDDPQDLRVSAEMSAPVAKRQGGARILTNAYSKDGQLYVTGADFKPSDAPCCPTLQSIYKVTMQKKTVMVGENDYSTLYRWVLDR